MKPALYIRVKRVVNLNVRRMGLGLGFVIRRYDIISNEIILLVGSDGRYQSFIIRLVKN